MKRLKFILPIVAVVLFSACEKVFFEPEPENNPEAIFENLWNTFKTDYANFDLRGVDWEQQYAIYRPQVTSATTDTELETVLQQLLATLNDGHVSLCVPNKVVFNSNRIINERIDHELFDLDLIKSNYLQSGFKETYEGANVYGWIGNVGYWFMKYQSDNYDETADILQSFSSADGLIIDMRHSSGGDFTFTFNNFGPFTTEQRFTHRSKTKTGTGPDDFGDWHNWTVYAGGTYFDKPIVVLTDRYTISAAERYLLALRTLPNVTFLGDTSSGGISTKVGKELANGWFYSVAPQKVETHDGMNFEGMGIPPNIYVKNTMNEITAGQDRTLEAAVAQF